MNEIIDGKENGLLIDKDDPQLLAKAINYLCNNPEIAKKMGNNGYEKARKFYSQKNIRKYEKIYTNLLHI